MASSSRHLLRLAGQPLALTAASTQPSLVRTLATSVVRPSDSSSSSASSPPSPPPPPSSRASRRSSRFSSRPGADLVGPPDPLSNLRPIKYGSAFDADVAPGASSGPTISITHPYSLNEFNPASSSSNSSGLWRSRSDHPAYSKSNARRHSLYFERLLEKLEEAELAHKLRMARADNFNQRFWQDNNARFIQALQEFRSRTDSSKAVATLKKQAGLSVASANAAGTDAGTLTGKAEAPARSTLDTNQQESELDIDSDTLATFYSAWLKANATRHRAYNRQLWLQTFGDLAPAFRYQALRAWAKLVGAAEKRLGRQ